MQKVLSCRTSANMDSSLKKVDPNKYELKVELDHSDLSGYLKRAEDMITDEIQIDGFRKGKAPKSKVKEKVGDQYILERALDIALQDSLAKILEREKIEVIKASDLTIKDNSASRLVYTVVLETFPAVKLADISKVKVQRKPVEVREDEVADAIGQIINSRAKFIPKNGAIGRGDRVEINFEITSGGLPVEGGISSSHPLVVGDNKFIPGFEEQLLGMKLGEEKKFGLKVPENHFHKGIAGKLLDCSVKVVSVQIIQRLELGDEFAKSLGQFQGVSDFKNSIKKGLTEEKKVKEKQRLRLEIISKISEGSEIEVPKEMTDNKLSEMITGFDNDLHFKGMELALYLAHLGKTEDDLRKDWRPEAEKQVKYALVLRKIAKEKNLQPSNLEVGEEIEKLVQSLALKGQVGIDNIDIDRAREAVSLDLINEKVFDFLESTCVQRN